MSQELKMNQDAVDDFVKASQQISQDAKAISEMLGFKH